MKTFKILIADDNEQNILVLKREIEKGLPRTYPGNNFETLKAEHGQQVLDIINENSEIDLILMDIDMPVMDGLTATEKNKANQKTKNIPVFAITAQAMKGDEEKCRESGCEEYVSKPIDRTKLKELIGKYLKIINN
jgi:CheY-like chemotaxis protein